MCKHKVPGKTTHCQCEGGGVEGHCGLVVVSHHKFDNVWLVGVESTLWMPDGVGPHGGFTMKARRRMVS